MSEASSAIPLWYCKPALFDARMIWIVCERGRHHTSVNHYLGEDFCAGLKRLRKALKEQTP
jgi:hypothetical protein